MQKFTVIARKARFGAGALLGLTSAQLAPRAHAVHVLAEAEVSAIAGGMVDEGGLILCRAERGIELKRGEQVMVLDAGAIDKRALTVLAEDGSELAELVKTDVDHARRGARATTASRTVAAAAEDDRRAATKQRGKPAKAPAKPARKPAGLAADETAPKGGLV